MTKKSLHKINQKVEDKLEELLKAGDHTIHAQQGGIRVTNITPEDLKTLSTGSEEEILAVLDKQREPQELYLRMPDVIISDNGSVKALRVYAYAAETKEDILLHKLFGKVKEQS